MEEGWGAGWEDVEWGNSLCFDAWGTMDDVIENPVTDK